MKHLVWAALALLLTLPVTWVGMQVARRAGLVDRPRPRKPHARPTPLAGGVGVAVGVSAALASARILSGPVFVAVWGLVVLGLVDDAKDLRARTRLAVQAAVVLPVAYAYGSALGLPGALGVLAALVWILAVVSAVNCIDCADGVAGGVGVTGALMLGSLGGWTGEAGAVAAALAGAMAGSLFFNRPPARCFLGEAGSTLLGFLLAFAALATAGPAGDDRIAAFVAAACVLALPGLDFLLVHARRFASGVRRISDLMASAGTDHLPHRMRAAGLSPAGVALACMAGTAFNGATARLAIEGGMGGALTGAVGVACAFFTLELILAGKARRISAHTRLAVPRGRPLGRAGTGIPSRILVTGGAGFLGSHFVRRWITTRAGQLLNLDLMTYAGSIARVDSIAGHPGYEFVKADACDREAVENVFDRFRPDLVVHFAAESHVTRSEKDPARFWTTNVEGTRVMLETAAAGAVSRFLHISTDEVYGPILEGTFREEDKLPGHRQATSAYAKSKSVADDLAREFSSRLEVVVVRSTNCFGPWQHPEKAFARWVARALLGIKVPVWGDGLHVRQWLYAGDLAESIALLLDAPSPDAVYNIGPRHSPEIANLDLVRWLIGYLGLPQDRLVLTDYDRPDHDRRYAVDPSRIEALGWKSGDTRRLMAQTVEWYRRSAWWKPLLAQAESLYADHSSSDVEEVLR